MDDARVATNALAAALGNLIGTLIGKGVITTEDAQNLLARARNGRTDGDRKSWDAVFTLLHAHAEVPAKDSVLRRRL